MIELEETGNDSDQYIIGYGDRDPSDILDSLTSVVDPAVEATTVPDCETLDPGKDTEPPADTLADAIRASNSASSKSSSGLSVTLPQRQGACVSIGTGPFRIQIGEVIGIKV